MTFWTLPTIICFAILSATVFKLTEEMYKSISPNWINKKRLLRKIENMIAQETDILNSKTTYPSMRFSTMNRVNVLVMVKEIIDSM